MCIRDRLTYIAKILHSRNSSEEFFNLIQSAKNELLDSEQNSDNQFFIKDKERNINLLMKEFNKAKNLDPRLVESLAKAKSRGYESWQEAKKKSDFKVFLPFFEELVKLRIEEAKQISDQYSPWETLAPVSSTHLTLPTSDLV